MQCQLRHRRNAVARYGAKEFASTTEAVTDRAVSDDVRAAWLLSTPMIKGELYPLLMELEPGKKWPKSTKLKDLIAFTVGRADPTQAG